MSQYATTSTVIMPAGPEATVRAVALLRAGYAIGLPTETVYGLAADATNDKAVANIFDLKGRPDFNPLIVHVASYQAGAALVEMNATAENLANAFWPGALTLVLPRRKDCSVSLLASAGLDTLAVRVPAHPVARDVLIASGLPLAAPSANRSGRISPTNAQHVDEELDIELVIDGGSCPVGVESTIVGIHARDVTLLRPGGVSAESIEQIIGKPLLSISDSDPITAPGQLTSHYAPRATLRLNATDVRPGEALLAFGRALPDAPILRNLSATRDLAEAAATLFAMLRDLDATGAGAIAVMPIPEAGLGVAINDRLRRAAAPRDLQR